MELRGGDRGYRRQPTSDDDGEKRQVELLPCGDLSTLGAKEKGEDSVGVRGAFGLGDEGSPPRE